MRKNKYRSYEHKTGNVWLNVWDEGGVYEKGSIEVEGNTASGYRIIRRGSLYGKNFTGLINIVLGDAGVYFEKRKDAENYSLILAMHFSGDLSSEELLDPRIFNGGRAGRESLSSARTELFWNGVSEVDPAEGWQEIDPGRVLEQLPYILEPLSRTYDDEEEDFDMRGYDISEAAEAIADFFKEWFLTSKVERSLAEIVSEVLFGEDRKLNEIDASDRGYVTLLALSELAEEIPASWIFPSGYDEVANLIPRLWSSLPDDVKAYIAEIEVEAKPARELAAKVEALKKNILSRIEHFDEENSEIRTRVHCCAHDLRPVSSSSLR